MGGLSIRKYLYDTIDLVLDHWPDFTAGVSAIGLAVLDKPESFADYLNRFTAGLFVSSAFGAFLGVLGHIDRVKRMSVLEAAKTDLEAEVDLLKTHQDEARNGFFELLENQLQFLAEHLGFGSQERITIYKPEGNYFVNLTRYSSNPVFAVKSARTQYPQDQGCIAEAYSSGFAFIGPLPDPDSEKGKYFQSQRALFNIPRETAKNFKMKARLYAGFAVKRRQKTLAVVVLESVSTNGIDKERLGVIAPVEAGRLADFLEKNEASEPSPAYAKAKGFG